MCEGGAAAFCPAAVTPLQAHVWAATNQQSHTGTLSALAFVMCQANKPQKQRCTSAPPVQTTITATGHAQGTRHTQHIMPLLLASGASKSDSRQTRRNGSCHKSQGHVTGHGANRHVHENWLTPCQLPAGTCLQHQRDHEASHWFAAPIKKGPCTE